MPIDFARIARAFARVFRLQVKPVTELFARLAESLAKRLKSARALESASSRFPVIAFHDEAVTLRLDDSQRGALELRAPPPSVGEHLAQGGRSFIEGFTQISDMVDQEVALPRFASSLDQALSIVERSVERWRNIHRLFDGEPRTASDLFGQLALGFRLLAESSRRDAWQALFSLLTDRLLVGPRDGDLYHFIDQLGRASAVLSGEAGTNGGGDSSASSAAEAPALPLSERLDTYAYLFLGGTMLIGSLPRFVDVLLRAVVLRLKVRVLQELVSIEAQVERVRQRVFDAFFVDLPQLLARVHRLLSGVKVVLNGQLTLYAGFARDYLTGLLGAVIPFLQNMLEFFRDLVTALRALPAALEPALDYDLRWFLVKDGSTSGMIIVRYLPTLTLSRLLDPSGTQINRELHRELLRGMNELREDFGPLFLSDSVARKWGLARQLFNRMFPASVRRFDEAPAFDFQSNFPDIGDTLFGGGRAERLQTAIQDLGGSLRSGVTGLFDELELRVGALAVDVEASAGSAAVLGSTGRYRRLAGQANVVAERFLGPEVALQRELLAARPADPLARAYERWLASGGFVLLGSLIPAYVRQMHDYWLEQRATGRETTAVVTPTSPHLLRQHARLGRVRVPRLRVHASSPARLDAAFADALADGFEEVVGRAYLRGRDQLRDMAAEP